MGGSWSLIDMPDLNGKTALVTGGNRGLGYKTSLELARKGAHVVLSCRTAEVGEKTKQRLLGEIPSASIEIAVFDLSILPSVQKFCEAFTKKQESLDILVCNAGVVNLDTLQHSSSGQEMHMAINHYGHYAVVGHLLSMLERTKDARVIVVTSLGYRLGKIDFEDMDWKKREYSRVPSYAASKLANMLFVFELNKRLKAQGSSLSVIAAHPGLTGTERQQAEGIGGVLSRWLASSVDSGCLPQIRAASDPAAEAGDFYGPRFGLFGSPVKINVLDHARDPEVALQLWKLSEEVTGVKY